MKCPCYDTETKTDCPKRHCGCQVDCPDWAEYVEARDDMYKKREADRRAGEIAYSAVDIRRINHAKGLANSRRRKRRT